MKRIKNFVRKNKELVALFSVPAVITVVVLGLVLIPRLFANPGYAFVYESCRYGCYGESAYSVDSNGILYEKIDADYYRFSENESYLYMYDPSTSTAKRLSIEEAQKYTLDASVTAPDGYRIERIEDRSGVFTPDYDYSIDYAYKKGLLVKKLDISNFGDKEFIGWVIQ